MLVGTSGFCGSTAPGVDDCHVDDPPDESPDEHAAIMRRRHCERDQRRVAMREIRSEDDSSFQAMLATVDLRADWSRAADSSRRPPEVCRLQRSDNERDFDTPLVGRHYPV